MNVSILSKNGKEEFLLLGVSTMRLIDKLSRDEVLAIVPPVAGGAALDLAAEEETCCSSLMVSWLCCSISACPSFQNEIPCLVISSARKGDSARWFMG